MSYTDEIKSIDNRMDSFEKAILEMKTDQKQGFEKLSKEIEGLKTGIHGNSEHDQLGYRQRINELESQTKGLQEKDLEHDEFKKKVLFVASMIGGAVTLLVNALILFLKQYLG